MELMERGAAGIRLIALPNHDEKKNGVFKTKSEGKKTPDYT